MEQRKGKSQAAYDYLMKIPIHTWARHAFDEGVKSEHITNNLTESFNSWLGNLRAEPILSLFKGLRTKLIMCRMQKNMRKGALGRV